MSPSVIPRIGSPILGIILPLIVLLISTFLTWLLYKKILENSKTIK